MHANGFLHKLLSIVMCQKHLATLCLLVSGALLTKKISVTNLGRGIEGKMQERSAIRRSDRFIGNKLLHKVRKPIYKAVIELLIGGKKQPEIIVDWSPIPNTRFHLLRASVITKSGALTIYEEVYNEKKQNNTKVQNKFLQTLSTLLRKACRPIIVSDAGFHTPWFKQIEALGWDYIGRIRNAYQYSSDAGKTWKKCKGLFKRATETEASLGCVLLGKGSKFSTTLYLVKEKAKGRKAKTKLGKKQRRSKSKKYSKSAREPWILCSSLGGVSYLHARRVRKIYYSRMQIEEGFRSLKSARYGLSFEEAFSRCIMRVENLLLVAMVVTLIAWLMGWVGERRGDHRQFQSNSLSTRRVLSLFFLGCQMIKRKIDTKELLSCINKEFCYAI